MAVTLNIIISGYGKMGKTVEKIAEKKGHNIVYRIDTKKDWEKLHDMNVNNSVIIDFSMPHVAIENIKHGFENNIPIVVGTTGWYNNLNKIIDLCNKKNGTLLYAPNFSIGVQILFHLNNELAHIMSNINSYSVKIKETHHIHKLDAPSGTAIKLANDILNNNSKIKNWVNTKSKNKENLSILSKRKGEIHGIHKVIYNSPFDSITIKHKAKSREGFAHGAILAAEFLYNKKGVYTVNDLVKTLW